MHNHNTVLAAFRAARPRARRGHAGLLQGGAAKADAAAGLDVGRDLSGVSPRRGKRRTAHEARRAFTGRLLGSLVLARNLQPASDHARTARYGVALGIDYVDG